jgi:outer membrane protein assembly factor BamB
LEEPAATPVRERSGRLFYGTAAGKAIALELTAGGPPVWDYTASSAIVCGPVFCGGSTIFGTADGRLLALDLAGKLVWECAASGRVAADPVEAGGRLYFGTENRFFYCLSAATGKKIWSRRLQGAPLHPAIVIGGRLAVPASNSVVYLLAGGGGSILSWEAVPSRIVHELDAAGPRILVAGGSPSLMAIDLASGKRVGEHVASGPLASGALWIPPFVVLVEADPETSRQRLVILKPKEAAAAVLK